MANSIDDVLEIIEKQEQINKTLERRATRLANYKGYGPPDLCYFVKEEKSGFFSKAITSGFVHYVYGADTSSASAVASYIRLTLSKSAEDVWSIKSPIKIKQAIFCIYDIVFHRDVRVDISFPGKMTIYSIDEGLKKDNVSDLEWSCAFVSSTIRSFHSYLFPAVRIIPALSSQNLYKEFITAAQIVIKKGFQLGSTNDVLQMTSNHLAGEIINYFIKNYMYDECTNFIKSLVTEDKTYAGFLIKATMALGLTKQAVLDATARIKEDSENAALLYYQAKGLVQLNIYAPALCIARYACELCPESTCAWVLLAQCYFHNNSITKALIALDMAPAYSDDPLTDGLNDKTANSVEQTRPKKHSLSDFHPKAMVVHRNIDYDPTAECIRNEEKYLLDKEDAEQILILAHLRANQLSTSEKQIYELLALIEKQIGWDQLIKHRNEAFIKSGENPWDKQGESNSSMEDEKEANIKEIPIKAKEESEEANKSNESREDKNKSNNKEDDEEDEYEEDEHRSDDEDQSKKKKSRKNQAKDPNSSSNVKKKKIAMKAIKAEEEKTIGKNKDSKKDEKSDVSHKSPKTSVENRPLMKRICEKIDNGLACLNDDLCALYTWEKEDLGKSELLTHKYRGKVWIYRGMLAERLNRPRMAERAYRRVISKGYSTYAWSRLLDFYTTANNLRASIACIAEVIEHYNDELGLKDYTGLPAWLEEPFFRLIAKNGCAAIESVMQEEKCNTFPVLIKALKKANERKVYNYNLEAT